MNAEFYLANKFEHNPLTGKDNITPSVLHFKLKKPNVIDPSIVEVLFDNLATKQHVQNYYPAYSKFQAENPDFECPFPEVAVEMGMAPAKKVESAENSEA